jgi:small ligand-binding sensory domain FIST
VARFGQAMVSDPDLVAAAERAAAEALAPLHGRTPDLAAVFVCGAEPADVTAAAERAATATGARATLGCSAGGVIGSGRAVEATSAVAVWCAVLPGVRVRAFHLEVLPADGGMAVVGMPERTPEDSVGVLLADPWSFPVDGFLARSNDALAGLPFVGGVAAGPRGRGSARLLLDRSVLDRGAVGVLLAGPVGGRAFVSQGCRPVGPEMTVTASDGNVILELAGTAAVTKLEEILRSLPPEDQALASRGLQLGIAMDDYADEHGQGDFLVRGIAGVVEPRAGLVVGDLVTVGRTVQFQLRDARAADDDLRRTAKQFLAATDLDAIESALLFSCNGRGRLMFDRPEHDATVLTEELAADGVAGFFAAGEIGPVGGRNHLHGLSASVLAFGSGPADRPAGPAAGDA